MIEVLTLINVYDFYIKIIQNMNICLNFDIQAKELNDNKYNSFIYDKGKNTLKYKENDENNIIYNSYRYNMKFNCRVLVDTKKLDFSCINNIINIYEGNNICIKIDNIPVVIGREGDITIYENNEFKIDISNCKISNYNIGKYYYTEWIWRIFDYDYRRKELNRIIKYFANRLKEFDIISNLECGDDIIACSNDVCIIANPNKDIVSIEMMYVNESELMKKLFDIDILEKIRHSHHALVFQRTYNNLWNKDCFDKLTNKKIDKIERLVEKGYILQFNVEDKINNEPLLYIYELKKDLEKDIYIVNESEIFDKNMAGELYNYEKEYIYKSLGEVRDSFNYKYNTSYIDASII